MFHKIILYLLLSVVFVLQIQHLQDVNTWSYGDTSPKFASDLPNQSLAFDSVVQCPVEATPIKMQPEDWKCLLCNKTESKRKRDGRKHCNACGQMMYRRRNGVGKKNVSRAETYVVHSV